MLVPNPKRCFNCNKSGHTSQRCKVAAKCPGCGKDKHEGQCEGPKLCSNCNGPHASSAKDCPVWQKEKERRFNESALRNAYPFRKPDSWLKPRCRLWSLEVRPTPLPLPPEESKSVECQTSLTFFFPFFQNIHLGRLSLTCVLLADPDRYRPALRLPPGSRGRYRPTPGFRASPLSVLRRQIGVQPIPPKRPLGVPPIPPKMASSSIL